MPIPFEVHNAQKVDGLDDKRLSAYDELWMQPKLDGFRIIAHIVDRKVHLFTRSGKSQDGKVPVIEAELLEIFPDGTVLDGEICYGDGSDGFEFVQQVMLSKPDEAARKFNHNPLNFVIFDALMYDEQDVRGYPYRSRKLLIDNAFSQEIDQSYTTPIATVTASEDVHVKLMQEHGYEGTIVRDPDGKYQSGKRGGGLFKWKPQDEVDAVILGFQPGTPGSEFDGLVGAIIFGQPLDPNVTIDGPGELHKVNGEVYVERGRCSGFPMDVRRKMSEPANQEALTGTSMSFKHMGTFPDSIKFRHPQFSRFRPDKPANEVIWDD